MDAFNYDRSDVPRRYAQARAMSPRALALWLTEIERQVPRAQVRTIVDLGCGTGRFSAALRRHYGARVVAVDPSQQMLAAAVALADESMAWVRAEAERIPLAEGCADLIFVSMVWHHIRHKDEAAAEVARVLRRGGYLCVRTATIEALDTNLYVRFFPSVRPVNQRTLPTRPDLIRCVTHAGLQLTEHRIVRHPQADGVSEYAERIALRALSDLAAIPDAEFEQGLRDLRRYAASSPPQEVSDEIDLFVFRRGAGSA